MSPSPQGHGVRQMEDVAPSTCGERVVISGMAGLYPQARYIKDFENILYNKLNPISSDHLRWTYNHPEVAQYSGNVPDLDRFDAQFFKVHFRLGNSMDSMSRKILEQAYEAIYDAGVSPEHLSGKKVGVYIGSCFSETEKACFYVATSRSGFGIAGCSKAMFANRISYWLNAKGPSMSIDEACCSSTAALEQAYKAISRGECEAAIVGGAYLCLHPQSSVHYGRIMKTSMDGKTKSFSQDAAGCAKSEAINVLFLQKAKDAKRIYANVVHVKSEFVSILKGENGPRFGFYREPADTANFLKKFYVEAGVTPDVVEYVEAFGSAVPEVDKSELEAIDAVFCKHRNEPLLIGSVMSNIGYGEAASGISAVTKVLLGYHRGELAGNLHCETPRQDVAALREGRLRVLTDNQCFQRTYTAVNSMSVTGVNAHVLLHGHYKHKDLSRYKSSIPRLVTISGRQETSVQKILHHLKSHSVDPEEIALLHNIHEMRIAGHLGRGFTILDTNEEQKTVTLSEKAAYFDDVQRPLWFVYSGMGSQWAGMGAHLMRIPIFAAAIERCRQALEPKGIDIVHIITTPDKTIFNNILHSFVGIAAVQIGLTNILLELGLVPDKIIGHSVGELGCAYADGCLTAEEMILSAYSRGLVSLETPFVRGSMAAVGMGFQQMKNLCPPEIEIACHNSAESCTISGPAEAMRDFVASLTAKGIFAKEVPCSNIAYHSRYIADAGPGLLKYLKEVIKTPRARSERWVSSSVPQDKWNETSAKYSSAEYHTNNLLNPVLFEETSALIPSNAVLVEVAPHGLLQAILKRALPDSVVNMPLTRRGHSDGVLMLLESVGKLFMEGYNPKVHILYPKVEFPVSNETPYLSHYVDWAHQEKWTLPLYQSAHRSIAASATFVVSIHDDEYSYLRGHLIKNKTVVPFSFVLVAVWDTLAMSLNIPKKSVSVQFQDVQCFVQPTLFDQEVVKLSVALHRGNGRFEVMDKHTRVATGFITVMEAPKTTNTTKVITTPTNNYELHAQDVYSLFFEGEYTYSGEFRSIYRTNRSLSAANVAWNDNWVTFIDSLFQLNMLKYTHKAVTQLDRIGRMVIDIKKHFVNIHTNQGTENNISSFLEVELSEVQDRTRCGGIEIENIRFLKKLQINDDRITLQTLKFVPRFSANFDVPTSLRVLLQITAENLNQDTINVIGLQLDTNGGLLFQEIEKIAKEDPLPGIRVQYRKISRDMFQQNYNVYKNANLILVKNLSNNDKICQSFRSMLQTNTFIMNEDDASAGAANNFPSNLYNILSVMKNNKTQLELAYWKPSRPQAAMTSSFTVHSNSDLRLLIKARDNLPPQNVLIVLTTYPPVAGLTNLVKNWRRDSARNNIHLIMVNENSETICSEDLPDVNLAYNIYNNGEWGGEYYLPLEEKSTAEDSVVKLQSDMFGNLDSLHWVQVPKHTGTGVIVKVHYAGINVGDVKKALGAISFGECINDNHDYGMDFSGITERGERVMGLVKKGSASSHVMAQPKLMWPVPSYWSLEDAATVPFAYIYAYYCIAIKPASRISTNTTEPYSVLVHGGAGALGQAAISIALAMGHRVFATVSDTKKKRFLLKLFPELKEEYIGNSRDASFGDMVLNATNGKGCNVVICCLNVKLKNISFSCVAPSSTMIDTTQILNNENYMFGLYHLTNERSYVAVDITSIIDPKSEELFKIHELISEGIARGHVRPLTRVTFPPRDAPRAFRLLAASRHRGRVLLRLQDSLPHVQPRFSTAADCCHLILCDSLGIKLADKLVESGVKKLHLHFSTPLPLLPYKLHIWENLEVQVAVTFGDLTDLNDVTNLLHSAMRLGPIEGIHVIANDTWQQAVISNLDLISRTICPTLKYFLVLNQNNYIEHHAALQRTKIGLPVTILDLSELNAVQDAEGVVWYRGTTEAMELALQSTDPILMAQPKRAPQLTLLQQLASMTALNVSDEILSNTSLEEQVIELEKSSAVCTLLRDIYDTYLDEEDIPSLTLKRIHEIEDHVKDVEFKEVKGLETFYSYVDPDELLATTEVVFMATLTNKSTMRDDEFDVNETCLCIVPGLEGHHARFRTLCERLKLPAFVLQPGFEHPEETPKELAIRYSKVILKKTGLSKMFYILGYETGVLVALELAAILEENGRTGTVFCLGDGPEETKAMLEQELSTFDSDEALQIGVVQHMYALMSQDATEPAKNTQRGTSWRERVESCVHLLLNRVPHSMQYARELIEAAYVRICVARRYNAEPRTLRSRVVLIRARPYTDEGKECSLQRYSEQPLTVENLATPMAHVTADLRTTAIINRHLDAETLQSFEKRNLCDTYLLNADAFMTSNFEK